MKENFPSYSKVANVELTQQTYDHLRQSAIHSSGNHISHSQMLTHGTKGKNTSKTGFRPGFLNNEAGKEGNILNLYPINDQSLIQELSKTAQMENWSRLERKDTTKAEKQGQRSEDLVTVPYYKTGLLWPPCASVILMCEEGLW